MERRESRQVQGLRSSRWYICYFRVAENPGELVHSDVPAYTHTYWHPHTHWQIHAHQRTLSLSSINTRTGRVGQGWDLISHLFSCFVARVVVLWAAKYLDIGESWRKESLYTHTQAATSARTGGRVLSATQQRSHYLWHVSSRWEQEANSQIVCHDQGCTQNNMKMKNHEIFTFWDEIFKYGVFPDSAGVGGGPISISIKLTEFG